MERKELYIIEHLKSGLIFGHPSVDDQILWDKVEELEYQGYIGFIVRRITMQEIIEKIAKKEIWYKK